MGKPDRQPSCVLVCDAEEKMLREVASTLEKAGFEVVTAGDQAMALDFCRDRAPAIELAIIDMAMSESGPELVEQLYRSHPGVRILFTSTHDESGTVQPVGPSGRFRGFLRKPFRRSQLLGRVLKAMDAPLAYTA